MNDIKKSETLEFDFGDQRLNRHRSWLAALLVRKGHTTIHRLSSEWKEQLACYRFMNNAKVTSVDIIRGLTQEMVPRIVPHTHYLILQDTTQPNRAGGPV